MIKLSYLGLALDEIERDAIIAIAQARWARAVVKDMALMTAATRAMIFSAGREELFINFGADGIRHDIKEAGPACA